MSKLFKTLFGYLLSQLFLLSFLINLLLTPIYISTSVMLSNCHWLFLTNALMLFTWMNSESLEFIRWNKNKLWEWSFTESCQTVHTAPFSETRVFKELWTGRLSPAVLVFQGPAVLERKNGNEFKGYKVHCSYQDSIFFLNELLGWF